MMKKILMATVTMLAFGCNSFNGTVSGEALGVASSAAIFQSFGGADGVGVVLADFPNVCDVLMGKTSPPERAATSIITVAAFSGVEKGTYAIGASTSGTYASAFFGAGRTCVSDDSNVGVTATKGSVVIDAINRDRESGTVSGTFELTFPGDDEATGSFSAQACAVTTFDLCD